MTSAQRARLVRAPACSPYSHALVVSTGTTSKTTNLRHETTSISAHMRRTALESIRAYVHTYMHTCGALRKSLRPFIHTCIRLAFCANRSGGNQTYLDHCPWTSGPNKSVAPYASFHFLRNLVWNAPTFSACSYPRWNLKSKLQRSNTFSATCCGDAWGVAPFFAKMSVR